MRESLILRKMMSTLLVFGLSFLIGCSLFQKTEEGAEAKEAERDSVGSEVSLSEDVEEIKELRKNIPKDIRAKNDELKELAELQGELKLPPNVYRDRYDRKMRKLRDNFRKEIRRTQDAFTKQQKKDKEVFLKRIKEEKEDFNKKQKGAVKISKEEVKEFYKLQDLKRKDFFSNQRDARKDFDSEIRARSRNFDTNFREQKKQFNQEYRVYKRRWDEREREKRKLKEKRKRSNYKASPPAKKAMARTKKKVVLSPEEQKDLQELEALNQTNQPTLSPTEDK